VLTTNGKSNVEELAIDHIYTNFQGLELTHFFSVSDHDILLVKDSRTPRTNKRVKKLVRDWREYHKIMAIMTLQKYLMTL